MAGARKKIRLGYAISPTGKIASAVKANRKEQHTCPECCWPVVLKRGPKVTAHFAHKPGSSCSLSPETALHLDAKLCAAFRLQQHLDYGTPLPQVQQECKACGVIFTRQLQNRFDEVLIEHTLPNRYRPDITLRNREQVTLGIEILVTHAVDDAKRQNIGIPFLELEASQVLDESLPWMPTAGSVPRQGWPYCQEHTEEVLAYRKVIRDYTNRHNVPADPMFVPFLTGCQHCGLAMLCHTWFKRGLYPHELPLDVEAPRNQELRYLPATHQTSYANVCLMCHEPQDDSRLYRKLGPLIKGTRPSYDLVLLAAAATQLAIQIPDQPDKLRALRRSRTRT